MSFCFVCTALFQGTKIRTIFDLARIFLHGTAYPDGRILRASLYLPTFVTIYSFVFQYLSCPSPLLAYEQFPLRYHLPVVHKNLTEAAVSAHRGILKGISIKLLLLDSSISKKRETHCWQHVSHSYKTSADCTKRHLLPSKNKKKIIYGVLFEKREQ